MRAETGPLEVLAYTTRQQRQRSYQDLGTAERLDEAEALLQQWHAWAGMIDGFSDWRFPPDAWKESTKLSKDTGGLLEHSQMQGRP